MGSSGLSVVAFSDPLVRQRSELSVNLPSSANGSGESILVAGFHRAIASDVFDRTQGRGRGSASRFEAKQKERNTMSDTNDTPKLSRRQLLTRVTLAAGAAYVAPVLMQMETTAAEARTSGGRPPKATRPTRPTRPSRPPAPTRPTRPSRPKTR